MGGSTAGAAAGTDASADVAIAVTDADGSVVRWSQEAEELLGWIAQEVCGRPLKDLFAEGRAAATDAIRSPTAGRAPLRHRSGDSIDVTYRVVRLQPSAERLVLLVPTGRATHWKRTGGAQGDPAGVVAIHLDTLGRQRIRRELALLHRIATGIGGSLDVTSVVRDLVDVLVPAFGDLAWVDLADAVPGGDEPPKLAGGGELHVHRAAVASATDDPWPAALLQLGRQAPPVPSSATLRAIQEGRAVVLDPETVAEVLGNDEPLVRLFVPEHGHSGIWAPLFARGLVLGNITVWRTDQQDPYDDRDAELLTEIASLAALGVDNARRFTRERRSVQALQQRLLPRPTADTPAVEAAGLYLPAGGDTEISGDWYDVVPLPSFRVALVVGDVAGNGLYATATMGRLRTAVRTLADLELDPVELLTHLDDRVRQLTREADPGSPVGATCLYVVYNPVSRRCALASAGHPPPVLLRPDGTTEVIDVVPGPPLGVGGVPFEMAVVDLEPGSVLALYTDGLIDREDGDTEAGLRWLTENLADLCGADRPLDDVGRALLSRLGDAPPRDDTALLLARTRAITADDIADWEFAADPMAVATARQAVTEQLTAWGLDELTFTTELIVSELLTNAVRYAGGPIRLRLIRDAALVCEITDPSNTQPRLRRAHWTDEGGRGLFLVDLVADDVV
ncbi:SpoIIE family protein phosphatase [Streptomyces sp. SID3343]|uniref:ATP-binding SpoIIE family protein phosphatase n=1 Tax=Streptomyces sp. SID3343 TaxID=2690260 RepID=UPI00136F6E83|nr:SpoIIE family protein phosphatase [Streptomyces sp. SID3343]MYV97817.1 SpoIIE family protein phosphatase [Streptomyces sp. SID3343]